MDNRKETSLSGDRQGIFPERQSSSVHSAHLGSAKADEGVRARFSPPQLSASLEIEGEATFLQGSAAPEIGHEHPAAHGEQIQSIPDHHDDVIVASLYTRQLRIDAGERAAFRLTLLNNGPQRSIFDVNIKGWLDERWMDGLPLHTQLRPGERVTLNIEAATPRLPISRAGLHPLAIVVRASAYPGRYSWLGALLEITPYYDLAFGPLRSRQWFSSWFNPTATLMIPLANRGNDEVKVALHGVDKMNRCSFVFLTPGANTAHPGPFELRLLPGQTLELPVRITPYVRPLFGLERWIIPFRITATTGEEQPLVRSVDGQIVQRPLLGLWQLAALAGLFMFAVVLMGIISLATLVALRPTNGPQAVAGSEVEQPVIAIVLKAAEPLPTRALSTVGAGDSLPPARNDGQPVVVAPGNLDLTAPIVRAEQVTAPGEAALIPQPRLANGQPSSQSSPPSSAMTYAQMFQEIALQYDLNWRMLAAQAYIESGFNSLALGNNGDLGLMQVLPATWHEWSPVVNVSDPFDSYSNVAVASAYLNFLRDLLGKQGYPQQEWMLVAYHWGPDRVLNHLKSGGRWDDLDEELKSYASDILRIAESIPSR